MMTGPEHFAKAEQLLELAAVQVTFDDGTVRDGVQEGERRAELTAQAQAHATLALAAATALAATDQYIGDSAQVTEWARCIQSLLPL